jgi:hypothetical protein
MLNVWRNMWSADGSGEPEPRTPWVFAALAVVSIAVGAYMSYGGTFFDTSSQHAAAPQATTANSR